ncbi:tape measure protein, partial [Candidatus Macondimonas diazotrophica]|nr:tape measure protein [Candidatus Macondimonas diazotrophica]
MARVTRSDVELVLTARDQITRTLADVSQLLDGLVGEAQGAERAFGSLDQQTARLEGTLQGLQDAQRDLIAKGRLVEQFKREEQQLSRLNERFRQAAAEVRRLKDAQRAQAGVPAAQRVDFSGDLARAQRDAQRANAAFRGLRTQLQETAAELRKNGVATDNLAASERRLVAEAQRLRAAQDQASAALARLSGNSARAGGALRRFGEDSRRALSITQRLRGEILSLTAGYVGLFGVGRQVGNLFEAARSQAQIESGLRVAFDGDPQAVAGELAFLRGVSDRLKVSFLDLGRSYAQFLASVPEGNFSLEESRQVFVGLATAGRVLRLSQDQMERSFRAVLQTASKGTVQMEELRGQLGDNLPGALVLFAEANGHAIEELEKLVEQGQVTSRELIPFAEALEEKFGADLPKALAEPTAALDALRVAWERTLLEMGEDTELIDSLAEAMGSLTEALDDPAFRQGLNDIANGLAALVRLVPPVVENIQSIALALGLAFGARTLVGIAATTARIVRLTRSLGVLAAVARAGTGPVGWAVGLATLILTWGNHAEKTIPKLADLRRELEELRSARDGLDGAPGAATAAQVATTDAQIQEVERRIALLQSIRDRFGEGFDIMSPSTKRDLDAAFEQLDLLVQKRDELARQLLPAVRLPTPAAAPEGEPPTPVDPKALEDLAEAIKKANDRIAELKADTLAQKLALIVRKYEEQAAAARRTADTADDALVAQAIAAEQQVLRLETEIQLTRELTRLQQDVDRQGDRGLAARLADIRGQYDALLTGLRELGRADLVARAEGLVAARLQGEVDSVKDQLREELLQLRAEDDADLDARLELIRQKYRDTIEALNRVDREGATLAEQVMNRRLAAARQAFGGEQLAGVQAEIDKALELRNAIIQRIQAQQELGNLTAREAGDQLRAELADLDPRLESLIA